MTVERNRPSGWRRTGVVTCGLMLAVATLAASPPDAQPIGIPKEVAVLPGIVSGGQPDREQLEQAAAAGYKTIVNLRMPGEKGSLAHESELVEELGMTYVEIPVGGADDVNEEKAKRMAEVLADPKALPAMVHCASGNRVGALFSMIAFHLDGKSPEEALQIGLGAGMTRLEPAVREKLGLPGQ